MSITQSESIGIARLVAFLTFLESDPSQRKAMKNLYFGFHLAEDDRLSEEYRIRFWGIDGH